MRRKIFCPTNILVMVLISGLVLPLAAQEQEKDPIKHQVRVSAQIVPLIVLDKTGKPVSDLKKEDLVLSVNGQEIAIDYLIKSEYQWTTKNETQKDIKPDPQSMRRLVFVIMDSLFNSRYGINRMKKICQEILAKGRESDFFIILGINKHGGLYHLAGPTPSNPALKQLVDQIQIDLNIKANRQSQPPPPPADRPGSRNLRSVDMIARELQSDASGIEAIQTIRLQKYIESLAAIRYLMMRYLQPKLVFLLSEGVKEGGYGGSDLLKINNIIKEINQAGAMIFTINPGRIRSFMDTESGKSFLTYVARESGGEFYENQRIKKVVKNLDNISRAYYEMVFHHEQNQEKRDFKIEVKSQRPGLKVMVPQQATVYQRFSKMSRYSREFFIVDLIEGGRWSQAVSEVKDVPFEISFKEERGRSLAYTLLVDIPLPMVSTRSDIYIVRLRKNQKTKILHYERSLKEQEKLQIKGRSGEQFFFVIHEPLTNVTLFAKVK